MDLSNASFRVYGGFLLTEAEITAFLDAPGTNRRSQLPLPMTPSNDITAYLEGVGCLSQMYPCILKPLDTPESENPSLTLIYFTTRRVRWSDVDLTDSGVVPRNMPPASEEARASVRRWLRLDPAADSDSETDTHVADLAARIFYVGSKNATQHEGGIGRFSSDEIMDLVDHVAAITGKERRELEFAIVYNEDDMRRIISLRDWSVQALAGEQERERAQSSGTAPSQLT